MAEIHDKIVEIVKEELHEMKAYDIEVRPKTFDLEAHLKLVKPKTPRGMCMSRIKEPKEFDENGTPLIQHLIVAYTNTSEISKISKRHRFGQQSFITRMRPYLDNFDIEVTDDVRFLLTLLHEYGHVRRNEFYRYYGMFEAIGEHGRIENAAVRMALQFKNIKKHYRDTNIDLAYMMSSSELHADNFTYQYFPRVWKRVKPLLEENKG